MPKPVAPSRASGDIVQLDFDGAEPPDELPLDEALPEDEPLDEPLPEAPPLDEPLLDDPPSGPSQSAHA
jgi:hypothetical protein